MKFNKCDFPSEQYNDSTRKKAAAVRIDTAIKAALRIKGQEKRMATIEEDPRKRSIIQARAKCNGRPGVRSYEIIRQWAAWPGLQFRSAPVTTSASLNWLLSTTDSPTLLILSHRSVTRPEHFSEQEGQHVNRARFWHFC